MADRNIYEIYVPTVSNEGKPYRTRYHRVWDGKVKAISHGLTIYPPVKGVWVSGEGDEYRERMIPVRIMCTHEEIVKIAEMTKVYYSQLAVLAYKVSSEVIYIE